LNPANRIADVLFLVCLRVAAVLAGEQDETRKARMDELAMAALTALHLVKPALSNSEINCRNFRGTVKP
jgi:hypothetical protein